jgi:hypothetical protein
MLTTQPLLVPRVRKSRSYTSCHPDAPLWSVTGPNYLFQHLSRRYRTRPATDNARHLGENRWRPYSLRNQTGASKRSKNSRQRSLSALTDEGCRYVKQNVPQNLSSYMQPAASLQITRLQNACAADVATLLLQTRETGRGTVRQAFDWNDVYQVTCSTCLLWQLCEHNFV